MTQLTWLGVAILLQVSPTTTPPPPVATSAQSTGISTGQNVTVKATITAIDKAKRTVTLRGPRGNDVEVHADYKVQRFDDLKVGDTVTATYSEAIAVHVRKPGVPDPAKTKESINRQPDSLAATITVEHNITVTIRGIDLATPSLTVEGAEGRIWDFRVRDKNDLNGLKVGDKVDVTYTEALLMRADR